MAYGFGGAIGLQEETVWGTAVAVNSGNFVKAYSENITLAYDRYEVDNIINAYPEADDIAGTARVAGELVFGAHPVALGHVLNGVMGVNSVTTVLSGMLFRNDFTIAQTDVQTDAPLPSYTFEIFRDVGSSNRYHGAIFTSVAMNFAANQDVRVTAGVIGKGTALINKSTITYPSSPQFPFTFETVSVSVAGAATTLVENLTLTIDNQLEGIAGLANTSDLIRVRRTGAVMARLAGTLDFSTLDEYNKFVSQSEQAIKVSVTRASSFALVIDIPRFVYTAFPLGMPGRERLTVGFEGRCRYHQGSGQSVMISLTTTRSY